MKTNVNAFNSSLVFLCICLLLTAFCFVLFLYACVCSPQGIKRSDHFGFICRDQIESGPSQYMCFVFQCANESLVSHTSPINTFLKIHPFLLSPANLSVRVCVLSYLCASGGRGHADLEAGLFYSSSSTEQQNRDPAV